MSDTIKPIEDDLNKINIFDPELMACPRAFFKKLRFFNKILMISFASLFPAK